MVMLRHTAGRKAQGYAVITDPATPLVERDTVKCVHCQKIWMIVAGSGIERGFCFKCMGPTCGKKPCETRCLPWEKEFELIEAAVAKGQLQTALERIRAL